MYNHKQIQILREMYTELINSPFDMIIPESVKSRYKSFYSFAQQFEGTEFLPFDKLPAPKDVILMGSDSVRRLVETLGTRITPIQAKFMDQLTQKEQEAVISGYEQRFSSHI